MDFESECRQRVNQIEEIIKEFLPEEKGYQKTVLEAMNYSILAGGKRIRPMLIWETYQLFGGSNMDVVKPFMAAMEMIHTYSLVHDDLPAMDNDDYRRGRLTTHKKFGEAMGILAGDALLNYAYETAATAFLQADDLMKVSEAFRILSLKAGIYGMVGGQVADVEASGDIPNQDLMGFIYENKTAALIEASMMIGAVLAGASEADVNKIEQIARGIGLAFQIQDDILDVIGNEELIGKPVHSDEKNDKSTYVVMNGMEQAQKAVKEYSETALTLLGQLDGEKEYLFQLFHKLMKREK